MDITAANEGDEPFTFELMGTRHTIDAGTTETVTIPLQEDQAYDFTITGPNGFEKRFKGVLDCATGTESSESGDSVQMLSEPSPATAADTPAKGTDLAETGSSGATPVIAGIAIALVVVGGAALLLVRKKKTPSEERGPGTKRGPGTN